MYVILERIQAGIRGMSPPEPFQGGISTEFFQKIPPAKHLEVGGKYFFNVKLKVFPDLLGRV